MNIALTGATGVLGGHVLRRLVADGYGVRALRRSGMGGSAEDRGVVWVPGSLEDARSLDALVAGADAIVHCAFDATEDPSAFVRANVCGTLELLHRAARVSARQFVFVSSLAVYGSDPSSLPGAEGSPLDEGSPLWPTEFYGAHKLALEKMVVAAHGALGLNASAWRVGCVLAEYPDPARDYLGGFLATVRAGGAAEKALGAYVISAADVARVLVGTLGDAAVSGVVTNTFDRWLDFATLVPGFAALLGRDVPAGIPAAPEPDTPISNARLRARGTEFGTDAELLRLLAHHAGAAAPPR